jgi:hypothetical protein
MGIPDAVRHAASIAFGPDDQGAVLDGLAAIMGEHSDWIQAATLALTFGDRELFDRFILTAQTDAHDVAYVIESPELVRPDLTRAELVRRYRAMGLPVPERLAGDS